MAEVRRYRVNPNGSWEKTSSKRHHPIRITFLIKLSRLGPLRVDLTVAEKTISGRFLSARASSQEMLEKQLPVLIRRLTGRGFTIRRLACGQGRADTFGKTLAEEIVSMETCSVRRVV